MPTINSPCVNYPDLRVQLIRTPAEFCSIYSDDAADCIIETRVFKDEESARQYCDRLINQQ